MSRESRFTSLVFSFIQWISIPSFFFISAFLPLIKFNNLKKLRKFEKIWKIKKKLKNLKKIRKNSENIGKIGKIWN